jgi:YVTN family beta-propeller protein
VAFLNARDVLGRALHVGNDSGVLIASDSTTAWAANTLSDTVQHLDMSGETSGPPIHVARAPNDLALTQDHRTLLVLSFGDGTHAGSLTAINTGTSRAGPPLSVGVTPGGLTLSPDGATAYIANHQANSITTVDLKSWRVSGSITLPCSPDHFVITPDGDELYADCSASAAVIPVSTRDRNVGTPIAVAPSPALVMGNQGKVIIVNADHMIQEIDVITNKIVLSRPETGNIVGIVPTPDDSTLVAIENTGGAVLLLNTATLATTTSISVGSSPDDLQLTPNGLRAYVLDSNSQKLYVVDVAAGRVTATVNVAPNAASVMVPSRR